MQTRQPESYTGEVTPNFSIFLDSSVTFFQRERDDVGGHKRPRKAFSEKMKFFPSLGRIRAIGNSRESSKCFSPEEIASQEN